MLEFNEEKHEYTLDGKKLISVTQLMAKYGLAPDYSGVDAEVLKKKAQRGTLIHQEIEDYLKKNEIGFTEELFNFKDFVEDNKVTPINSELMVNNDIVAGTIDLILFDGSANQPIIADIKTTSQVHTSSVSWQLSIYLYLYLNSPMADKTKIYDDTPYDKWIGQVYHFDSEHKLEVLDITLQPYSEVEKLMNCERTGTKFELDVLSETELTEAKMVARIVQKAEQELKEATERYNQILERIRVEMEARNLKEFTKDGVKIECKGGKKASTRTSTKTYVDEDNFAKENPVAYDVYKKFIKTETKTTPVAASPNKVTITILEDE